MTAQTPGCGSTSDARKRLESTVGTEAGEHELERLRAWKAEAMPLFDGLQDLGRALGLPLGVLITGPVAIAAADDLRRKADKQGDLGDALRQHREDWASYIETWGGSVGWAKPDVPAIVRALRTPNPPFGVAAAPSTEGGADRG